MCVSSDALDGDFRAEGVLRHPVGTFWKSGNANYARLVGRF